MENALNNFNENYLLFIFVLIFGISLFIGAYLKEFSIWVLSIVSSISISALFGLKALNQNGDFDFNIILSVSFAVLSFVLMILLIYLNTKKDNDFKESKNKGKNDMYDIY